MAGGVLLTTSLAALLTYRRRRRDAKIRPGQRVPTPDPRLTGLHTSIRANADPASVDRVSAALHLLAAVHTGPGKPRRHPVPQVMLHHTDGTVDVFLRDPIDRPPPPWIATAAGQVWTLPAVAFAAPSDQPPPCPALVELGTTDDGAHLYADLEALGVLAIDAAGADLRSIARALTATLAVSPHAQLIRIRAIGFDPYGLTAEDRLIVEDSLDDLIEHTLADAAPAGEALDRTRLSTTFALRHAEADDNWEPTVAVIATDTTNQPTADRLAHVSAGGRGAAVIIPAGSAITARWRLSMQTASEPGRPATPDGQWRLDPLGIPVAPVRLAAAELADLTALLADVSAAAEDPRPDNTTYDETDTDTTPDASDAASNQPAAADPPDRPALQVTPTTTDPANGDLSGPDWTVMVRLIGPVEVISRDGRTPERPVPDRTLEVLAWLVTHRTGASRLDLETAIWRGAVSAGTVMNQLSRARQVLEQLAGPAARAWIPAGQVTLNRAVISDLDILRTQLTTADRHAGQPDLAIPVLHAAVGLIRGIPARYPWLDAEIGSTLTTLPTTAAARLAELHLRRGDRAAVFDVTARGLSILPAHTELFALRLRAAAAAGDRAAVKAEYEAYLRAEQADPLWDGDTDRDLQQLYHELLHPNRRAAG